VCFSPDGLTASLPALGQTVRVRCEHGALESTLERHLMASTLCVSAPMAASLQALRTRRCACGCEHGRCSRRWRATLMST
jgi:hypothetical protein